MAFVSSTILQKTLYIHEDMIIYTLLCVCSSYIYMLVNEGGIKKDDIRFCCISCFRNFHRSYSGGSCRVAYINAIHKDCILPCFVVQGVANRCFLNSLCRITTKKSRFSITGPSGKTCAGLPSLNNICMRKFYSKNISHPFKGRMCKLIEFREWYYSRTDLSRKNKAM